MRKFKIFLGVALVAAVIMTACKPDEPSGNVPNEVVINGIKWATRNVGSKGTFVTNPNDYGNYYAWQQAQTACPDGWRLPTKLEFESLMSAGGTWITQNGKDGYKFGDSKNNIFLPAAGQRYYYDSNMRYVGASGYYWSSTSSSTSSSNAYYLEFSSISGASISTYDKKNEHSVRCVAK